MAGDGRCRAIPPRPLSILSVPSRRRLNYLAGVDEAGLGPILGPLVVGGVAMAGPPGVDPWTALSDRVSRDSARRGKVRVADSKKVHQGQAKLENLERTVLTFWGALHGGLPPNLAAFLDSLSADTVTLRECPWYGDLDLPLPLAANADEVEQAAHNLARALEREGLTSQQIVALVSDARQWNESIARTDNKSHTHFDAYMQVMATLLDVLPDGAHVVADRCGGLQHYVPGLRRALPGVGVRILDGAVGQSRYEISRDDRSHRLTFAAQGEDRAFPTALASCFAKYARETLVHLLNRWFCGRVPGLKPTAGYYTDGRRFLRDIAAVLRKREFPRSLLVRCR